MQKYRVSVSKKVFLNCQSTFILKFHQPSAILEVWAIQFMRFGILDWRVLSLRRILLLFFKSFSKCCQRKKAAAIAPVCTWRGGWRRSGTPEGKPPSSGWSSGWIWACLSGSHSSSDAASRPKNTCKVVTFLKEKKTKHVLKAIADFRCGHDFGTISRHPFYIIPFFAGVFFFAALKRHFLPP